MKKLLEAINRGILKGLNEQTIELISDLDDGNLDQMDSLQSKSINSKEDVMSLYKNIFIRAVKNRTMISDNVKNVINNPANFQRYKGIITATSEEHLKELINIGRLLVGDDGNYNWIDTSELHSLNSIFINNKWFNGYIDLWDTSSVESMDGLFWHAESFNRPIEDWDVSRVKNMCELFYGAKSFNQPIGNWDVSNVTDMEAMFYGARAFNQPIGNWDVRNVTKMKQMFYHTNKFNQDISNWQILSCEKPDLFDTFHNISDNYKPIC